MSTLRDDWLSTVRIAIRVKKRQNDTKHKERVNRLLDNAERVFKDKPPLDGELSNPPLEERDE